MYCKVESARVPETIRLFSTVLVRKELIQFVRRAYQSYRSVASWLIAPISEFLLAGVAQCDELLGPSLLHVPKTEYCSNGSSGDVL